MKKRMWAIGLLCLCACSANNKTTSEGSYTNAKGAVASAKITWEGDQMTAVELDETTEDTTKKTLGDAYDMKPASAIGKNWNEQIAFLETYIVTNGIDQIRLNEEGKAENEDILTGCTISIDSYLKAVQDAQAKRP